MSDTSAAAAPIPPGWYDDGTGTGQTRWWSGIEWTQHVASSYSAGPVARPALPADRPVYSVFIWLIVLLPLLSVAALFAWQPQFTTTTVDGIVEPDPTSIYTPVYFLIGLLGWVIYGLSVFFAYRDVVWLRRQGVVRPFHWAWTFLMSTVYVIGRSVIVHRVAAPRGRAPIWVVIAVLVVGFVAVIVLTVNLMSGIVSNLPHYGGQAS